jgi:diguanylate cyclase (GGDEF)-like protein/PAS domain S-box-containing protein
VCPADVPPREESGAADGSVAAAVLRSAVDLQHEIVSHDLDRDAVMRRVVEYTRALTGAASVHVAMLCGDELVTEATSTPDDARLPDRFPASVGLAGIAVATRRSVLVGDIARDERASPEMAKRLRNRSLIAVPLLQAGETIGVLFVSDRHPHAFDERDVANVELLSLVLAAALSHAGQLEAQRDQLAASTRMRAFFDGASIGIAVLDEAGHGLEANDVALRMLGYTADELRECTFEEIIHPDHLDEQRARHAELLAGERSHYELEKRYVRKSGEELWAQTRMSLLRDEDGAPLAAIAMMQDITERKLAEIAVRRNAERLARIVETQRDIAAAGTDLTAVMRLIVERIMALTKAEGAMVSLVEGDDLVVGAAAGIAVGAVGNRRAISSSIVSHAFDARDTLLIERVEDDPRMNRALRSRIGDRSHVCVPLFEGDRPVAALNVMSRSERERLGEDDRRMLELLAVVLAAAVSRAAELEARRTQVEALARFEATFAGAHTGMLLLDLEGRILDANPAAQELLGRDRDALVGREIAPFVHEEDLPLVVAEYANAGEDVDSLRWEHRLVRADGEIRWVDVSVSFVRDADGRRSFIVGMMQDVTQRKEAEAALVAQAELNQYQALHDALTGLANRTLFRDRIEQAVKTARRGGGRVAVLVMDLDRFKEINDSLGHAAGDELLVELGGRLERVLRASDTVARLGGDEFGVLLPDAASADDVVRAVERIRAAIEEPVIVQGLPLSLEASVGISVCPDHGDDVETLLQHADVAMYAAKAENAGYAFYEASSAQHDPSRLTLVGELRRAIEQRELELFYQPKAVLADGAVRSVEALLRWRHPVRGLVPPDEFIPLAQQTGLVRPLTLYVVDEALRQVRAWHTEHDLRLAIAVNLSPRNLLDVHFPAEVQALLDRWQVDASLLEFEITESTMLVDPVRTKLILERLSEMGIRLSIDDFGTGYSSLSYLRSLPVNEIKIDRSFVMNMDSSVDDATIVRSTIDLARNLGLEVVAEGVETEVVWDRLGELGCTVAQGYYLSRPVSADDLRAWLDERRHGELPRAA